MATQVPLSQADVGKSSLLLRFLDDKFRDNYESTLGVEFGSKTFQLGNNLVKTMIWDTAGQESIKSIIRSYYKKYPPRDAAPSSPSWSST